MIKKQTTKFINVNFPIVSLFFVFIFSRELFGLF